MPEQQQIPQQEQQKPQGKLAQMLDVSLPEGSRRFLIAMLITCTTMGMFAYCIPVPSELMSLLSLVIGFYFGRESKK